MIKTNELVRVTKTVEVEEKQLVTRVATFEDVKRVLCLWGRSAPAYIHRDLREFLDLNYPNWETRNKDLHQATCAALWEILGGLDLDNAFPE